MLLLHNHESHETLFEFLNHSREYSVIEAYRGIQLRDEIHSDGKQSHKKKFKFSFFFLFLRKIQKWNTSSNHKIPLASGYILLEIWNISCICKHEIHLDGKQSKTKSRPIIFGLKESNFKKEGWIFSFYFFQNWKSQIIFPPENTLSKCLNVIGTMKYLL